MNALKLALAFIALATTAANAQGLPDAPKPHDVLSFVQVAATPFVYKPIKPVSFFHHRTNRELIAAELAVRTMDAISTRQTLTNPCRCFVEGDNRFGDGQLFRVGNWRSASNGFATQESYDIGIAGLHIAESRLLWSLAQHRRPGKLRKVLQWASREPMMFDIQDNLRRGFIHNEVLSAEVTR